MGDVAKGRKDQRRASLSCSPGRGEDAAAGGQRREAAAWPRLTLEPGICQHRSRGPEGGSRGSDSRSFPRSPVSQGKRSTQALALLLPALPARKAGRGTAGISF